MNSLATLMASIGIDDWSYKTIHWTPASHIYYPERIKKEIMIWLLINNRYKFVSKDIKILIIQTLVVSHISSPTRVIGESDNFEKAILSQVVQYAVKTKFRKVAIMTKWSRYLKEIMGLELSVEKSCRNFLRDENCKYLVSRGLEGIDPGDTVGDNPRELILLPSQWRNLRYSIGKFHGRLNHKSKPTVVFIIPAGYENKLKSFKNWSTKNIIKNTNALKYL